VVLVWNIHQKLIFFSAKFEVEGTVEVKCDFAPEIGPEYKTILHQRTEDNTSKARTLLFEDTERRNRALLARPVAKEPKREAREITNKEELQVTLFSLFEKKTYFDFKELQKLTNQNAVCDFPCY
jgi:hypothetical protein